MPATDACLDGRFVPGAFGSTAGSDPTKPVIGSFLDPDDYDPASVVYSLDFSKFYNSFYMGAV